MTLSFPSTHYREGGWQGGGDIILTNTRGWRGRGVGSGNVARKHSLLTTRWSHSPTPCPLPPTHLPLAPPSTILIYSSLPPIINLPFHINHLFKSSPFQIAMLVGPFSNAKCNCTTVYCLLMNTLNCSFEFYTCLWRICNSSRLGNRSFA